MSSSPWPTGVMTALVTPLNDDSLNLGALAHLIEHQISAGVAGVVVAGGTGEYGALSLNERKTLAREAIRIVDGRISTVIQTGALATRDAIDLSQDAERSGASGILVASPFGEPITWRERLRFYEDLTASVSLPIMIYNTPPSGLLTFEQIQQIADLPHVTAVKDSSGDPVLLGDLLQWAKPRDFAVYVGLDSGLYEAVGAGAHGVVNGTPNVVPSYMSAMVTELLTHGQSPSARAAWEPLRSFLRFMEESPNYMALCKVGCRLNGIDVGDVRAPYLMPEQAEIDELKSRFEQLRANRRANIQAPV